MFSSSVGRLWQVNGFSSLSTFDLFYIQLRKVLQKEVGVREVSKIGADGVAREAEHQTVPPTGAMSITSPSPIDSLPCGSRPITKPLAKRQVQLIEELVKTIPAAFLTGPKNS